jgi:hypothetical protein
MPPDILESLEQLSPARRARMVRGLQLFHEAFHDAAAGGYDVWQFAVRLDEMHAAGLTSNDARWLVTRGVVSQGVEVSAASSERRVFIPTRNISLPPESGFVLRPDHVGALDGWLAGGAGPAGQPRPEPPGGLPLWDTERRELLVGPTVVKRFRVPAPSQELILSVFEEEKWPRRIDDPLPAGGPADRVQRLHDAVRGLNRNQRNRLIRFERDGRGEGVCWTLSGAAAPGRGPSGGRATVLH